MSTDRSFLIDTAIYVAENGFMQGVIISRVVGAVTGFILVSILLTQWRKFVAHFNLMLLLGIHITWVLLTCFSVAIVSIYVVYQQHSWRHRIEPFRNGSDLLMSGYTCYLWRAPPCACLIGVMFSLIIISIERLLATICHKNYEKFPKWTGMIIGAFQIIVPVAMTGYITIGYGFDEIFPYCSIVSAGNLKSNQVVGMSFIALEFAALIIFHVILYANYRMVRNRERASLRLSERYQLTENIRTLRMITPLVWCHFTFNMFTAFGWNVYAILNPNLDPHAYPILEETINIIHLHSIALPIVLYIQHRIIRKRDRRDLESNGVGRLLDAQTIGRNHFQAIEKGW